MKSALLVLLTFVSFTSLIAQSISLPIYEEGKTISDSIYSYYGSLTSTGKGSVSLNTDIASNFATGLHFKFVVDSINQGQSPTHAAFVHSSGEMIQLHKGDTIILPVFFQLYAGEIGFHLIIEGTPQIANESYPCELDFTYTLGSDWEMYILQNSTNTCKVDNVQAFDNTLKKADLTIYPNPVSTFISIDIENTAVNQIEIFNAQGEIAFWVTHNFSSIDLSTLPSGIYTLRVTTKEEIITQKFFKE